jgi:hypothetical protein
MTTLNYHREMRSWLRRHAQALIILSVVSLTIGAGFYFREKIVLRTKQMYWARQCATFTPATQIISARRGATTRAVKKLQPACWSSLASVCGIRWVGDVVFLHEQQTPSGERCIVQMELVMNELRLGPDMFQATVIRPPSAFAAPQVFHKEPNISFQALGRCEARVQYATPDELDPSHFSIDFDCDQLIKRGTFDCYLEDDHTVRIKLRDTPTPNDFFADFSGGKR